MFLKTFDSMQDLAAYADTAKSAMPDHERSSRSPGREAFSGVGSWTEALALARRGWPEGCADINALTAQLFAHVTDRMVRPEMTAAVRLPLEVRSGVLALPLRAVRQDGTQTHVLVRRGEGFVRRAVRLGARDDGYGEIVDGVAEGDEVAIGGREGA